jgi:hypothetical protein
MFAKSCLGSAQHPNSGASLRDAVDRVDRRTRQLAPDTDPDAT